jgi:hypothetical protein
MSLPDTGPEARRRQLAVYRSMSPERKVEIAFAMSEEARQLTIAGIRARKPHLDDDGVRLELLRVLHGSSVVDEILARQPVIEQNVAEESEPAAEETGSSG